MTSKHPYPTGMRLGEPLPRSFVSRYWKPIIGGLGVAGLTLGLIFSRGDNNGTQYTNLSVQPTQPASAQSDRCIPGIAVPLIPYTVQSGDYVNGILLAEGLQYGPQLDNARERLRENSEGRIGQKYEITAGEVLSLPDLDCDGSVGTQRNSTSNGYSGK